MVSGYYISEFAIREKGFLPLDTGFYNVETPIYTERHLAFRPATVEQLRRLDNRSSYQLKLSKGVSTYIAKQISVGSNEHRHIWVSVSHVTPPGKFEAEERETHADDAREEVGIRAGSIIGFRVDLSKYKPPDVMVAIQSSDDQLQNSDDEKVKSPAPQAQSDDFNPNVEEKFEKYFGYLARCEGKFCTTTLFFF